MDELSDAGKRANLEYYRNRYLKAVQQASMLESEMVRAELQLVPPDEHGDRIVMYPYGRGLKRN
jgi:hypothetical protein